MAIKFLSGVNIDSNTLFVDDVNNRVGIGTGSPAYRLDVNVASNSDALRVQQAGASKFILNGDGVMTWGATAASGVLTWDTNIVYIGGLTNNALGIWAGGSEKVRITTGGNVGIGTTAPTSKLYIEGGSADWNETTPGLSVGTIHLDPGTDTNDYGNAITFGASDAGGGANAQAGIYLRSDGNYGTKMYFATTDSYAAGSKTRMFINNNGNIGIGTTSPSDKLHIYGTGETLLRIENSGTYLIYVGLTSNQGYVGSSNATPLGLYTNGSNRIHITTGGNIGIGTTSPTSLGGFNKIVHISGGYASLVLTSTTPNKTWEIGVSAASLLTFYDGVADRMVINTSGNVGIGTTSPSQKLEVNGNIKLSNNSYVAWRNAANNADIPLLQLTSANEFNIGTTSSSVPATIKLHTNSAEGARLTSGGQFIVGGTTVGYAGTKLQVGNTSDSQNGLNILTSTTGYGYILFGDGPAADTYVGQIWYYHGDNYMAFQTNGSEKLRITSAGNVGIGTTSPSEKLHVVGNGLFTGGVYVNSASAFLWNNTNGVIRFGTSGTERARIDAAGNVGIGTTSPSAALEILSTTSPQFKISNDASNTLTVNHQGIFNITTVDTSSNFYQFRSNNSVSMVIKQGNVGIGTTAPSDKLHVQEGDIRIDDPNNGTVRGLYIRHSGITGNVTSLVQDTSGTPRASLRSTERSIWIQAGSAGSSPASDVRLYANQTLGLMVSSSGNVGIGTTSPAQKLEVAGSTRIQGNIQLTGQATGYETSFNGSSIYSAASTFNGESGMFGALVLQSRGDSGRPIVLVTGTTPTERMRITDTGNVGIGTTSPSVKLHISGAGTAGILINNTAYNSDLLRFRTTHYSPGFEYKFWMESDGLKLSYAEDPSYAHIVHYNFFKNGNFTVNAGNVGIGTTGPKQRLDVAGAGGKIAITNTGTTNYSEIIFYEGATVKADIWVNGSAQADYAGANSMNIWQGSNAPIAFYTNGSNERLRITAAGNVGIGTTSPAQPLHVYTSGATPILLERSTSNANVSAQFKDQTSSWYIGKSSNGNFTIGGEANLGAVTVFNITSAGNVGIGTTSPVTSLDITKVTPSVTTFFPYLQLSQRGTVANSKTGISFRNTEYNWDMGKISTERSGASNSFDFVIYTALSGADNERMRITSAGNVGIGTTSTFGRLQISGTVVNPDLSSATATGVSLVISNSDTGYGTMFATYGNGNGALQQRRTNTNTYYDFLLQPHGGNVGIGTTAPSQKLHVSGNVRVTGAYYDSNNSAGSSGQVLSSTGSGTAWVNQGEAVASSLFDLLPNARVTYDWTVQLTAGTWADIFSSTTVLSNGTWMVQAYVNDFAVGGQQYMQTYSGIMSWGNANSTNNVGIDGTSEIILHRSGHAAQAGNFYLRTVERASSTLLFQGMSNLSHTAATTINFKFVKIF